jgi:hypothetical protein
VHPARKSKARRGEARVAVTVTLREMSRDESRRRRQVGRASVAAALTAPALVAGILLLLWAATAGPAAVLRPSGRRLTFGRTPAGTPSPSATSAAPGTRADPRRAEQTLDLHWLGDLLAWAVLLAFAVGLVLVLRLAWQHRWHRPEAVPDVDFEVLPTGELARALAEDVEAHLDAVAGGTPRNAIVRCWLLLEESVARAGLPRQPFETSAEFTVRVLHRLDLDPRAIGGLAALYREARFSEHDLGEDARTAARDALELLHQDLRRAGAPR